MTRRKQKGFSLAEALMAGAVLTISMIVGLSMILVGALTNQRNKLDTSATLLAQNVQEVIQRAGASSTAVLTITDCTGAVRNIGTNGAAGGGAGAPLTATGAIDFTAAPVGNYSMTYVVCRADGDPVSYDVRWNVINLRNFTAGGTTVVYVKQVTVAARPIGAGRISATGLRDFALPVTLRGTTSQN